MARRKKEEKVVKKEIVTLTDLLEDVYHSNFTQVWDFGVFLTQVNRRCYEEKDSFKKKIEQKRIQLEETPLTRKQFEEKINELEEESKTNIFETSNFNSKAEYFNKRVLEYYVAQKIKDKEKAEEITSFIWEKLDFMSLLFFFRIYDYDNCDEDEEYMEFEEKYSPCSENHIYTDRLYNNYSYQGNLVDRIIGLMDK